MTRSSPNFEKLPNAPSSRRRDASSNPWLETDVAERRKPIALVVILIATLAAGVVLILLGLGH